MSRMMYTVTFQQLPSSAVQITACSGWRKRAYLGKGLVEVEVLLVGDVGGAAQPERLVLVEQVPVPHRLLHCGRLWLLLLFLVILIICMSYTIAYSTGLARRVPETQTGKPGSTVKDAAALLVV